MAQLKKTVQVTNGSQTVTVPGQNLAAFIKANHIFLVVGENVPYFIAADATFNGVDTVFVLSAAYQGATNLAAAGAITTGKTASRDILTLAQGDVGTATIFTLAMNRIAELFDLAPDEAFAGKNTDALPEGTTNQYFSAARVLLAQLLGFTAQNAVVAPTDTVITGIGKLQGQHSAHLGSRGDAHGLATQFEHGFLANVDKQKLDKVAPATVSATAPTNPVDGQRWINTTNGITYTWTVEADAWVQLI